MRDHRLLLAAAASLLGVGAWTQAPKHLNAVVDLLAARKPVFGVYGPRNPRARPGAATTSDTVHARTPAELAKDALGYSAADFLFDGSMEGDFDRALPIFAAFAKGIAEGGEGGGTMIETSGAPRFHHPLFVKVHEIAPDPARAVVDIGKQQRIPAFHYLTHRMARVAVARFQMHAGTLQGRRQGRDAMRRRNRFRRIAAAEIQQTNIGNGFDCDRAYVAKRFVVVE